MLITIVKDNHVFSNPLQSFCLYAAYRCTRGTNGELKAIVVKGDDVEITFDQDSEIALSYFVPVLV